MKNSPVTQIVVNMQASAPSLLVQVTDQEQRPDAVPIPSGDIWCYLSFTLYRADLSAIDDAVITFGVPKDVLAGGTAVLLHYTNCKRSSKFDPLFTKTLTKIDPPQ